MAAVLVVEKPKKVLLHAVELGVIYGATINSKNYMSNGKAVIYEAPQVEVLEIAVEQGFAVSSVDVDPWGNGGHLGDYDVE